MRRGSQKGPSKEKCENLCSRGCGFKPIRERARSLRSQFGCVPQPTPTVDCELQEVLLFSPQVLQVVFVFGLWLKEAFILH